MMKEIIAAAAEAASLNKTLGDPTSLDVVVQDVPAPILAIPSPQNKDLPPGVRFVYFVYFVCAPNDVAESKIDGVDHAAGGAADIVRVADGNETISSSLPQ